MKGIMDAFCDDFVREIVLLKCTQIGGTECMLNMMGYTIDRNPLRMYYVLPDDDLCVRFSEERVQKMFRSCANRFADKIAPKNDAQFIKFQGGFVNIVSARSPSKLASFSAPIIFLDEIDKFPLWSGKEANPIKLAEERAKNWPVAKIVKVSTPTVKTGAVYKAYESTDIQYGYCVPCPHCGKEQLYKFSQVKWPKNEDGSADKTAVKYQAYYECEYCHRRIDNRHKPAMLKQGCWKPIGEEVNKPSSIGFSINSIYSPWLSFGDVAVQFLSSKDDPEELMNFVNSWLGEPWEDKAAVMDKDVVQDKRTEIPEGIVPQWAQLITGGVDVQKAGFYWTVRAWGYGVTSQNIAHGWAESFEEVEAIMCRYWPDEEGELRWQVNLCAMDSGYNTEEVYDFCLMNDEWCVPVKGASTAKVGRFTRSQIDAAGKQWHGQALYIVNGDAYKDMIASRLRRPIGRGCWMTYADSDIDYAEQITSEHKIVTVKARRRLESWVPKTSHAANHYLDAEVYAAMAADLLHVRYLDEKTPPASQEAGVLPRKPEEPIDDDFINVKGDWI